MQPLSLLSPYFEILFWCHNRKVAYTRRMNQSIQSILEPYIESEVRVIYYDIVFTQLCI